jgi:hypothetical protein
MNSRSAFLRTVPRRAVFTHQKDFRPPTFTVTSSHTTPTLDCGFGLAFQPSLPPDVLFGLSCPLLQKPPFPAASPPIRE